MHITAEQREAVAHFLGPMLVVAGAGSGKTTVLAQRAARLVREQGVPAEQILLVTYTNKAARQLREKIKAELNDGALAEAVQCGTFHSFCAGVLARHGRQIVPLEELDLRVYLEQRWEELPRKHFVRAADPGEFLDDLLKFISRCQDELVTEADYRAYVERLEKDANLPLPRVAKDPQMERLSREQVISRCHEIADVYGWLRAHLRQKNWGTFGDLVVDAAGLLEVDPRALQSERERTRFLLVDEFQDSNFAQAKLLRLLGGDEGNVFAVGDPDQSIYGFRGANAASFEIFKRLFEGTRMVNLDTNFRSLPEVLQVGYRVIERNPSIEMVDANGDRRGRSPLISGRSERAKKERKDLGKCAPQLWIVPDAETEAALLADELERLHAEGQDWSACGVLYRNHSAREALLSELRARSIPADVRGVDLLETPELRDLCAIIQSIFDFGDSAAILRVCALPQSKIDLTTLRTTLAMRRSQSLAAVLPDIAGGEAVLESLRRARARVSAAGQDARQSFEFLVRKFGLANSIPLQAFRVFVTQWLAKPTTDEKSLEAFADYLALFRKRGGCVVEQDDSDEQEPGPSPMDSVQIMTVHKAKGLEFENVFILRLTQSSFPSNHRPTLFEFPNALSRQPLEEGRDAKQLHAEEERRLFYVAITRAKDALWMFSRSRKDGQLRCFAKELAEDASLRPVLTLRRIDQPRIDIAAHAAPMSLVGEWLAMPARADVRNRPLSASSIQSYDTCPLKFKIENDLNLPGKSSPQLHFGSAIHVALKAFYDSVKAGRTIEREDLLRAFEDRMQSGQFQDDGQRALYLRNGREQLSAFYVSHAEGPMPKVLATEMDFTVEIGGVVVKGRIDRIDDLGNGEVAIEDYKSGRARNEDHAKENLQLSIYALAARQLGMKPKRLSLYSVEDDRTLVTERKEKELLKAEEKVRQVAAAIGAREFAPKAGFHCKWCDYAAICPAQERPLSRIASAAVN